MSTPTSKTAPAPPAAAAPTPAAAGAQPAQPVQFPVIMWRRIPDPPFFQAVTVLSAEDAKPGPGKPLLFATAQEAQSYPAPEPQPIDHIARTGNPEQFDERKSQAGRAIPTGVIQTEPPVQNVYVQTGVDPATTAVFAVLPEGVDAATTLSGVTAPGMELRPGKPAIGPEPGGAPGNPPAPSPENPPAPDPQT